MRGTRPAIFFIFVFLFCGHAIFAHAARLTFVSDTISDSRPLWLANHTIVFKTPGGIPASGSAVITFENNSFLFDPAFGYQDIDLAVSTSSPYSGFADRNLAATANGANDGAAINAGNGSITLTLSSGGGIAAGSYVRILLGTNAAFGGSGTYQLTNPGLTASYRILLDTYNASNAALDSGAAMVVILPAVAADVNTNKVNPAVLSNGLPSGTIPSNISGVLLSLNTDTFANCRYATTSGVSYDVMTNSFAHTSLGTFHTASVSGIVQGVTYNFYVRCVDFAGNKNPTDYIISFTAGNPTGTGSGGGAGSGGGGGGGGGGAAFPAGPDLPSFAMSGISFPGSVISVLQDGKKILSAGATAGGSGNFSVGIPSLPQGTYSFTLQVNDSTGNPISSYTTTITVISGTANSVTGVVMPPTVTLVKNTVSPGSPAGLVGLSEPGSTIEIQATSQANLQNPVMATTTADENGVWSYSLGTAGFAVDTYQIKAQSVVAGFTTSKFSDAAYLGVGQAPVPKSGTSDLNGDGKVNLVDFSILLFHWGTNYQPSDFNNDGIVNLIDFSILLFHWTG